jgi:hypothetical protein
MALGAIVPRVALVSIAPVGTPLRKAALFSAPTGISPVEVASLMLGGNIVGGAAM